MEVLSKDVVGMLYGRVAAAVGGASAREAFAELRAVFDFAISEMLQGDVRTFSSQYSRWVYLCSKTGAPADLRSAALAFLRRAAGFPEKTEVDRPEVAVAAATLLSILQGFSGERPWEDVLRALLDEGARYKGVVTDTGAEAGEVLSGVVTDFSEIKQEDGKRYFVLYLLPGDAYDGPEENIQVTVREAYVGGLLRGDLMRTRDLLRPFCMVNITEVEAGSSSGLFHTSSSSLIVIEPDYLVDVTDIASCFASDRANPNMFLLSKFSPDRDSEAMFKGTLINDLLDAYLKDEETDPVEVFRKALSKNLLKAARYGGQAVKRIWDSVLAEHGKNIAAFAGSLRGQRVTVEPSFISALYGIQGRLDVLTEYPDDPLLKNIYELKSGKAPSGTMLWRANQIQVACYDMLLSSVYGPQRRGTSALFYSSAAANPLRNFLSSRSDRELIIALRNEIIALVYRLAEEDYAPLADLLPERFGEYPPYVETALRDYAAFYKGLSGLKRKYYQAFLSFSLREMIAAKTGAYTRPGRENASGGYASLWKDSDARKRENFALIDNLSFDWFDKREHLLYFTIREPVEHTFRPGDTAVLYPHLGGKGDVLRNQSVKGTIRRVDADSLAFSPRGAQMDMAFFRSFDRWAVEHDVMEKGYWAGISGLFGFLSGRSVALRAAMGQLAPSSVDFDYRDDDALTQNQNDAVRAALSAGEYFLLQGPPGTGKTSGALMGMVRNILEKTDDHVVLLAFTNRAVQEIASKLRKNGIRFLRLGHESAAGGDRTLSEAAGKGLKINGLRDFLAGERVILATVSAYTSRADDLSGIVKSDVVIVDEASQLTEVQLAGVLSSFKKFILIGDQKQLPAVMAQSEALSRVEDEDLRKIGLTDLRNSLFERLWDLSLAKGYDGVRATLDTHFRMHDDIAALVNPFYGGILRSGCPRQQAKGERPRLVFIPSLYEPAFKRHSGEARQVAEILAGIKKRYGKRFTEDSVGVVTPWRAQIAVIKHAITDPELLEKVVVDTVERFQGGEKDVMIVSMAVFSPSQMKLLESVDGSGSVDRKLNVTLSRAREEVIVLGYEPALVGSVFYAGLLEKIREYGLRWGAE